MAEAASRRRTFGPVVLVGLGGAVLAAIAGDHQWRSLGLPKGTMVDGTSPQLDSPATTALALVALAAWGVVLVTRGRLRRAITVLAAVAAIGAFATCFSRPDTAAYASYVPPSGSTHITTTAWPWVALVAALLSAVAGVLAFLWAPQWPEMGTKYDTPTGPKAGVVDLDEAVSLEIWKTMSEGHDPTSDPD